ncbi:MAG: regulatory protein RecX [Chitinophagia bacterium]|jgi:regulatory protein
MDEQRYKRKVLTPEQAHVKIRHYCAFQERTHQEVKQKLSGYGISWSVANELLSKLIEEGFLNEERFARAFAGGRFRMKAWGKRKITAELKKRGISDYSIRSALREEIPQEAYEATAGKILAKKWASLKGPGNTEYVKQAKTRQYLMSRGFENDVINKAMKNFLNGKAEHHDHTD